MLLMTSQHPQRRRRSRPRVFCAFIGAQRRALTDGAAEGTPRQRPMLAPARTHAVAMDFLRLRVFPPGHAMVPEEQL
jgi:hypothetical protein